MPDPAAHMPPTDPCLVLTNRRAQVRLPCPDLPPVRYLLRPSMKQGTGVLWDFSAAGAGLVLPCRLEAGATLLLQLPGPARGVTHTRLARVAHATPLPGERDTWLVGCRLTPPLSDGDFDRLRRLLTAARD